VLSNFNHCHLYYQIPLLANSTSVTVNAKFHYFQIPHFSRNYTLPSNSNTCKFQDNWFTAKYLYSQTALLAHSYNPSRRYYSVVQRSVNNPCDSLFLLTSTLFQTSDLAVSSRGRIFNWNLGPDLWQTYNRSPLSELEDYVSSKREIKRQNVFIIMQLNNESIQ